MRLSWVTDIHLDFLSETEIDGLCARILADAPDGVLVGGDIAQAPSVVAGLLGLERRLQRPIWFVLGNHDAYHGSIAAVREAVSELSAHSKFLRWMPRQAVVPLTNRTALVGHDGWADARAGDWDASRVMLNDHVLIDELSGLGKADLRSRLAGLGDEAASYFRRVLPGALEIFERVVVLTHVPPFVESCWHEGKMSDADWLPHFVSVAVGEVLKEIMLANPLRQMTVLCGHTHSSGEVDVLPNLRVLTGGARYGQIVVQAPIDVD